MRKWAVAMMAAIGILSGATVTGLALQEPAQAQRRGVQACPSQMPGDLRSLTCGCPSEATRGGSVWGSGPYTADSSICRAAVHAGVLDPRGGVVTVRNVPGRSGYGASARNGVSTSNWGSYSRSIIFDGAPEYAGRSGPDDCAGNADSYRGGATCACPPAGVRASGSVWGSGPYTTDSDVCTAARHAGVLNRGGGIVSFRIIAGQPGYRGSNRNGVSSSNWGSYSRSFVFEDARGDAPPVRAISRDVAECPANGVIDEAGLTCGCSAAAAQSGGSVWGSGPYTADSNICTAARHAGVIGPNGGLVSFVIERGAPRYLGSRRNGVSTSGYGSYDHSMVFVRP